MRAFRCCCGLIVAVAMSSVLAAAVHADPNCKCRLAGQRYELGTVMCVMGRLSRCVMNLNNTSWKPIAQTCPQADMSLPPLREAPIARLAVAVTGGAYSPQSQ